MSWAARFKLAFEVFKRTALPLYLWHLIFLGLFMVLMIVLLMIPASQFLLNSDFFNHYFHYNPSFQPDFNPINSNYTRLGFLGPLENFSKNFFVDPAIIVISVLFYLVFSLAAVIAASILQTGTFNLVKEGLTSSKAYFKDFRLRGLSKLLALNFLLYTIILVVFFMGITIALITASITNAFSIFVGIYLLGVVLFFIFLAPWLTTAGYYILAYSEHSFGSALGKSWQFFMRNMAALWGTILAIFLLNLGITFVQEISSTIGGILSFLAAPLFSVIPIVWVLTLIKERDEYPLETKTTPFSSHAAELDDNFQDISDYHNESEGAKSDYIDPTSSSSQTNESNNEVTDSFFDSRDYQNEDDTVELYTSFDQYLLDEKYHQQDQYHEQARKSDLNHQVEKEEINFCPTCGSSVKPNYLYCSKCGTKLR